MGTKLPLIFVGTAGAGSFILLVIIILVIIIYFIIKSKSRLNHVPDIICAQPSTAGYDYSGQTGSATSGSFSVTGIACAPGYIGNATAEECSVGNPYTVRGCELSPGFYNNSGQVQACDAINQSYGNSNGVETVRCTGPGNSIPATAKPGYYITTQEGGGILAGGVKRCTVVNNAETVRCTGPGNSIPVTANPGYYIAPSVSPVPVAATCTETETTNSVSVDLNACSDVTGAALSDNIECDAVQMDGTSDGSSSACTYTAIGSTTSASPVSVQVCDVINQSYGNPNGVETVSCTGPGNSIPATAKPGYYITTQEGRGILAGGVKRCTVVNNANTVICTGPGNSIPVTANLGNYISPAVLPVPVAATCAETEITNSVSVDLNACANVTGAALSDNIECDAVQLDGTSDGSSSACTYTAIGSTTSASPVSVQVCDAINQSYGNPNGVEIVSCTGTGNSIPAIAKPGYYITTQESGGILAGGVKKCTDVNNADTVICTDSTYSVPVTAEPGYYIAPAVPPVPVAATCAETEITNSVSVDLNACANVTGDALIDNIECDAVQLDGTSDGSSSACTYTALGSTPGSLVSVQVCDTIDQSYGNSDDVETVICTGPGNSIPSTAKPGYYITTQEDGGILVGGVKRCTEVLNAETVICTDSGNSVPVTAEPGFYLEAGVPPVPVAATCVGSTRDFDCATHADWTSGDGSASTCRIDNGCNYTAIGSTPGSPASVQACDTIDQSYGNSNGVEVVSCTGSGNSIPLTAIPGYYITTQEGGGILAGGVKKCTDVDNAETVICTDSTDSVPVTAEPGYYIRATMGVDGLHDRVKKCDLKTNAATVTCTDSTDSVPVTAEPGFYVEAGVVDTCTPVLNAETVTCTDSTDSVPVTADAGFYVENGVVNTCTSVLNAASVMCTDHANVLTDSFPVTANTGYYIKEGGGGLGNIVEKCTPIVNAATVTCTNGNNSFPLTPDPGFYIQNAAVAPGYFILQLESQGSGSGSGSGSVSGSGSGGNSVWTLQNNDEMGDTCYDTCNARNGSCQAGYWGADSETNINAALTEAGKGGQHRCNDYYAGPGGGTNYPAVAPSNPGTCVYSVGESTCSATAGYLRLCKCIF